MLEPNFLLPTEHQLAKRFGVSRVTVRVALDLLERNGLVSRLRGRGTTVSPPKITRRFFPWHSFEQDLMEQGIDYEPRILFYNPQSQPPDFIRERLSLTAGATSGFLSLVRLVDALPPGKLAARDVDDLAAAFQAAVGDVLEDRCRNAMDLFQQAHDVAPVLVAAGGVAANGAIRARLDDLCAVRGFRLVLPPPHLCTDNATMIAWAGIERLNLGLTDTLDFAPRPRWPLDPTPSA